MTSLSKGTVPPKPAFDDPVVITVKILGKDFQVTCTAGEQEDLTLAASQLDKRMREIREAGKVIGLERIAVMAGLNITHEYLQAKDKAEGKETTNLLKKLNRKLDNALQSAKQLEI
ncbi:MAG: cell division protein ZapA [Gammaproteobacteria bacterium]|nr:cell division protein ZapA [Gammaproteobacteria bacterium]MBT8149855.1 cell division protein ZapA [Gammaproteobacteria bacterium]NND38691.1 cell division protein ZapA [Pseudomonadales bacterium]NNL10900.1 cell division protein ZapA [Pseudomonadales bacterium]NNM11595.1 cell division protein ZapA [Pseudomonadales bacterium]